MDAMNTYFKSGILSFFTDHGFYFPLCLFYHLLDTGRMNSSVHDQFFKCNSCHLTTNRIKSGKNDCFRSIINNQIHTRQGLKCTDVTAFTSDDSSFHLIAGQLNYGNSCLRHMIYRTLLNCSHNILFRFLGCIFSCSCFQLFVEFCGIDFHFIFNRF